MTSDAEALPAGKYDFSHLTQARNQDVCGPVQDDEALLLFALIRVMCMRRVLEIGGLSGYSAANFVRAVGEAGLVFTVDISPVRQVAANHVPIVMDAMEVMPHAFGNVPFDLVFFDCHDYHAQMTLLSRLADAGLVTARTVLALHDTNLHPNNENAPWSYQVEGGWVHQTVERRMVNELRTRGYDAISLDTAPEAHGPELPVRHGLTIMKRFQTLVT